MDNELLIFLNKPPESVQDVLARLIAAPAKKQAEVREAIARLLGDKSEPQPPLTQQQAEYVVWVGVGALLEIGLTVQQFVPWALAGVERGDVTLDTVNRLTAELCETYNEIEQAFTPILDGFLRYKMKQDSLGVTVLDCCDVVLDDLHRYYVDRVAREVGL